MLFLPLGSCIFFSLTKGWGCRTVWVCFLVFVFGNLCAKTARNAARFSLLCFLCVWASCLTLFEKVRLGLGFCLDEFCVGNWSTRIGPYCGLIWCCKQHEMLPVFLFVFFRGDLVFWMACFGKVLLGLGCCLHDVGLLS